jgi:RNA polymerase sigma-70 factor (ECF subfamily)
MSSPATQKTQPSVDQGSRIQRGGGTHWELGQLDVDRTPGGAASVAVPSTCEQLYLEHFDFVFRTLRHLGVLETMLPDAVQDVWLAAHRQLSTFEGRSSHRTWLFGIALNVARRQRRSRQRHQRLTPLPDDLPDARPGPHQAQVGREAFGLVRDFLATLDEPRRVLFISQLLEELSADETAELLGIERRLVYHRVRDLRRAFKRWLLGQPGAKQ